MSEQKATEHMKTGTTTVGIAFKGGVLLAADKRATIGNLIGIKDIDKVVPIAKHMAVTTAGSVSDAQLLVRLMKSEIKLKELKTGQQMYAKEVANLLARIVYNNIRTPSMMPGVTHFILGGYDPTGSFIYDIFPDGSVNEFKNYVASGSGSTFAYGVLETLHKDNMSFDEAKEVAVKAINAAVRRDSASGNGISLWRIDKDGARQELSQETEPNFSAK